MKHVHHVARAASQHGQLIQSQNNVYIPSSRDKSLMHYVCLGEAMVGLGKTHTNSPTKIRTRAPAHTCMYYYFYPGLSRPDSTVALQPQRHPPRKVQLYSIQSVFSISAVSMGNDPSGGAPPKRVSNPWFKNNAFLKKCGHTCSTPFASAYKKSSVSYYAKLQAWIS